MKCMLIVKIYLNNKFFSSLILWLLCTTCMSALISVRMSPVMSVFHRITYLTGSYVERGSCLEATVLVI